MASFTETVERRNPALTATGLAVWGWIIRAVIAISILILPSVVGSMTPLVTYGSEVSTLSVKYAPELATLAAIDPATQAALNANPANTTALTTAVGEVAKAFSVTPAVATTRLTALAAVPKSDLLYLSEHGTQVETDPYTSQDLMASVLKGLGISLETTFTSKNGRPMKIANSGKVIKELFV